jgi:hypothetical protein
MKICRIDGCDRKVKARGLCDKHYLFARRSGNLEMFDGPGRGRYAPDTSRTCSGVSECGKEECARGLCNSCYQMRRKTGKLNPLPIVNAGKACKVDGCSNKAQGLGYCGTHYDRFKKYGDPLGVAQRKTGNPCSTDGCSGLTVALGMCRNCYSHFKRYGDPTKRSDWFKRRSEKIVDEKGYVFVYVGKHGNATRSSRVPEHRYVMSQFLGRPLLKNENVHHKNGDRSDNRIENLELWATSQPTGQRPLDLIEWARIILKTYASDEKKLKELEYRNQ